MGDNYITKKVRVVFLACDTRTGPSSSFLPNIIKICLRVSKLRSTQNFDFRVDNNITKKVRVVSLAHDTPTGHLLHLYQILAKYVLGYQIYRLHKAGSTRFLLQERLLYNKESESSLSCT